MTGYYDNISEISRSVEITRGGPIDVPAAALDAVPFLIKNLPPDEIVYAGWQTIFRDAQTGQLTIDADDCPLPLPGAEWFLRIQPALMRATKVIGEAVVADGFLLDCRRVAKFNQRRMDLEYGTDTIVFQELQQKLGTVLPDGVLFNVAGHVEYHGNPDLQDAAGAMMRRVDTFLSRMSMAPYLYSVQIDETELYKSTIAAETLARDEDKKSPPIEPVHETPAVRDVQADEV